MNLQVKLIVTIIVVIFVTITIHHYCLDTRGPCNNYHYLGHVKNVYDDDDVDTADRTQLF